MTAEKKHQIINNLIAETDIATIGVGTTRSIYVGLMQIWGEGGVLYATEREPREPVTQEEIGEVLVFFTGLDGFAIGGAMYE